MAKLRKMAEDFYEKCVLKLCDVFAAFGLGPKRLDADARVASKCSLEVLGNMFIGIEWVIVLKGIKCSSWK